MPHALIVEHRLGQDPPLDAEFSAAGFDAVVLVGAPPSGRAESLAAELLAKAEFAPIVLVWLQEGPPRRARCMGCIACTGGRSIAAR